MEDTYTIKGGPLRPHEYIVVRSVMTAADEAWIQNRAAKVGGDKNNPQIQLTIGDVDLALLKRMIVNWNMTRTGEDGKQHPIELSDAEVERLPRRVAKFVKSVINKLNPDDEDYSDFLPGADAPSETNETTTIHQSPRP